jgi:predicted MFS family arabinose efflux permease
MAQTQQWPAGQASSEWRNYWQLVFASGLGYAVTSIPAASLGAYIEPLEKSFGWSRSDVTTGLILYALLGVICQPFVGRMIDLWGPRRIALAGLALSGITFAMFGSANGSVIGWIGLWVIFSLSAQMILPMVWAATVASEFEAGRGLALAVMFSGSALTAAFAPSASTLLIETYGWRTAYVVMGLAPATVALIFCWLFLYGRHDRLRLRTTASDAAPMTGATTREGLKSPTFYKMLFATVISYTLMIGMLVHLIPIMSSSGLTRDQAALVAGSIGFSTVAGKLICGVLVNRLPGNLIAGTMLALPIVTALLLMMPSASLLQRTAAASCLGMSLGAQTKMLAYLTSRHFGMLAFGTIFGIISIGLTIATGVGPFLASLMFDLTGSYRLMLTVAIPLSAIGSLLMMSIGGYREERAVPA